ncbi:MULTISPECIES: DMT family transporter [Halobacillus]|uniref:DMT family transporter n=1 Tax=Halobacillus TaxID=45667 RepID=UPI000425F78F|nr:MULTISPECIES: DMT family transporter [Halobacillus]
MSQKSALFSIGTGAALWGIIGFYVTYLYNIGFTPAQVVSLRVLSASLLLGFYLLSKDRRLFKIKAGDSRYFIGTGIISIVLFNWCLFSAIEETSISVASILLYTAPAFVTILSRLIFKESLTVRKVSALLITFLGCALVVGIVPHSEQSISMYGLILGLGSGLFYALYSIFGKFALVHYDSLTVTFYTFVFASIAIVPFSGLWNEASLFSTVSTWLYVLGLGLLSTMLPFILYTKGLSFIESSKASIIATIEPVVATLMGFLVFQEQLTLWQYSGVGLVITAVIVVQDSKKNTRSINPEKERAAAN